MLLPGSSRPLPPLRALAALLLPTLALLPAAEAGAQCVITDPGPPVIVTCAGADTDGFTAVGDDHEVTVETGATVSDDTETDDSLIVNDDSTVTVETGATVSASGTGLDAIRGGNRNSVTNSGSIVVTGDGGIGISMGDGVNDADPVDDRDVIINEGSINFVTDGIGIQVGNDAQVVNRGTITGAGDNAVGIEMGDGLTPYRPDPAEMDVTEPLNQGTINVSGDEVVGIRAGSNNEFVNGGTITVTADPDAMPTAEDNPIGVDLTGTGNDFDNVGNLLVSGDGGIGIRSGGDNTITNRGNLTASTLDMDDMPVATTAIQGSAGVETVENFGRISGHVLLGGGNDVLRLQTGSSFDTARSLMIDGEGGTNTLELLGDGTGFVFLNPTMAQPDATTFTGFDSLTIDGGSMGTAVWGLAGDAPVTLPGGMTVNGATVSLADQLTIAGPVNLNDGTTLQTLITPGGAHGQLTSTGAITLVGSIDVDVRLTAPLLTDTTVTILDGTSLSAVPVTLATASTTLLDVQLVQSATDLQLTILRSSYASVAGTPNQEEVGRYLDRVLQGSPGTDVQGALLALDTLTSAGALRDAYDALHPEAYDAHTGAMARLGQAVAHAALRPRLWCKPPLSELRPGRYQEEPCGKKGFSVFLEALAGAHERDAGSDWLESDGNTQGVVGGVDWRPDPRFVLTGWAGLASIDLDVDGVGGGNVDTIELGISGLVRLAGARLRAALGYGRGDHEQDREIRFGAIDREARGIFDSNRLTGLLELGYVLERGGLRLEPLAEMDVVWVQEDALEEEGAGGLGLAIDERSNTLVSTGFGARLSYRHVQRAYVDPGPGWAQGVWTPEITARWRSTWTFAEREIDAALQGVPDAVGGFTTEARDSEQGAEIGAHLTFQPHGSGGAFSVGYDGYVGDAGMEHRAGARLMIHF